MLFMLLPGLPVTSAEKLQVYSLSGRMTCSEEHVPWSFKLPKVSVSKTLMDKGRDSPDVFFTTTE
jgi:hypothetical protein